MSIECLLTVCKCVIAWLLRQSMYKPPGVGVKREYNMKDLILLDFYSELMGKMRNQ